ncbi:MAG: C25 family cysteine peptidase [Thermoanaerobaculia bacterium]
MVRRFAILIALTLAATVPTEAQSCKPSSTTLCIDPISWNIIGLDSNKFLTDGPDTFMVGARACNYTAGTLADVTATYNTVGAVNPHITLADNSLISIPKLDPGRCEDFYFNGRIARLDAAFYTSQGYTISAASLTPPLSAITPANRALYIEKLNSQNRNTVGGLIGPTDLQTGGIYTFKVNWATAPGGYEQLEHFVNLENTSFQLLSSYSVYDTPALAINSTIYADGCGWDNDTTSPTYRSCIGPPNYLGGKVGGNVLTYFTVKILGATPSTGSRLKALIYDFSGSSYHYNTDYNSGTAGLVVTASAAADLRVTITDSPDPVKPGDTINYSAVAYNDGLSPVTGTDGMTVKFAIPAGTTFDTMTSTPAGWSCPAPSGNVLTCSYSGTPFVSGSFSTPFAFSLTVDPLATPGTIVPAVATISSEIQDPTPFNNLAIANTLVASGTQADLVVTNTTLDPVYEINSPFTYIQTVKNQGFAVATSPTFVTQVPPGAIFGSITTPDPTWTCGTPVSGTITCTKSTPLGLGETTTFSLNVTTPATSNVTLSSTAYATTTTSEATTANNVATASVGVVGTNEVDVAITVADFPDPVVPGESIRYAQLVENRGVVPALNVSVSFPTPPNTTYSWIDFPAGWTCSTYPLPGSPTPGSAGTITCTKPSMAVGETANFPLTVSVNAATPLGTTIQYTGTVSTTTTDSIPTNNTATVPTLVGGANTADLSVVKTDLADPVTTGSILTYNIVVTNNGPAAATNITVSDTLPANTTYQSVVSTRGVCSHNGLIPGAVNCTIAGLGVGGTATITLQVNVLASASGQPPLSNTVNVSSTTPEPTGATTNNSSTASTVVLASTAASMLEADAVLNGSTVDLTWSTSYEVNNIGFNVYRADGSTRTRVNPSLVAGSVIVAGPGITLPAGFSYRWIDRTPVEGAVYWIEDVDLDGSTSLFGPIVPRSAALSRKAEALESTRPVSLTFDAIASRSADAPARAILPSSTPESAPASEAMPADVVLARQFDIAGNPAARIRVATEGYYRVTRQQLIEAGFDPGSDPWALALFVDGGETPIAVSDGGDGRWDATDYFEFYATGIDTTYAGARAYWLIDSTNGLRFRPKSKTKATAYNSSGFPYTLERKERTVFFGAQTNGTDNDSFYGPPVYSAELTRSFQVTNIDSAGSGATLEIALQGATILPHRVRVSLNGNALGTVDFYGQSTGRSSFALPQSALRTGTNNVTLVAIGGSSDVSFLDYIRLSYPHTFKADGDVLRFPMPGATTATIGGFTTSELRVLDVTDPAQPTEVEASVVRAGAGYSLVVSPHEKGNRILYATSIARAAAPAAIEANAPSELSSQHNGADFVIISHPRFLPALGTLADRRASEGLSTSVVSVEDVFDEFGFGAKSPDAIRDFLGYTQTRWKVAPRYVLFVGDATFDPRNYVGYGDRDLVPTRFRPTKYMKAASDDWLADFDGDGSADMYLGRISVTTLAEAQAVVAKITGYTRPSPARVLLVVDQNDRTFSFAQASATIRNTIPAGIATEQFSITSASDRPRLLAALRSSPLIVNYVGHGSIEGWSNTSILRSQDVASLAGSGSVPFFVMMDCLNAYFADVYSNSLGEALLKAPNGGAIAVWASTALSDPPPQVEINMALYRLLAANPSITIGELVSRAKAATTDHEVRTTWMLLGDPTMKLSD